MSVHALLYRLYQPIPPSLRAELKWILEALRELRRKAQFWKWVRVDLSPPGCTHEVRYSGRGTQTEVVELQLSGSSQRMNDCDPVAVSEFPLPGSLRVPRFIQPVVPLDLPLDDLLACYGDKLRRVVRQQLLKATIVRAATPQEIAHADETMLQPYARARYGPGADQLSRTTVMNIATRPDGRMDILHSDGEAAACHLGFKRIRKGKLYWNAIRFGFAEAIFTNSKRLHEVNSVNVFLATKYAKENGFDYYGLGDCLARPDDGLLHWKRRRGGILDASQCQEWFYVRLPERGACSFLWNTPLFSAQLRGAKLTLHIGIPKERSDTDVLARYREMSFGGLFEMVIHTERPLAQTLLDALGELFENITPAPRVTVKKLTA
jgi:hypothetical protein